MLIVCVLVLTRLEFAVLGGSEYLCDFLQKRLVDHICAECAIRPGCGCVLNIDPLPHPRALLAILGLITTQDCGILFLDICSLAFVSQILISMPACCSQESMREGSTRMLFCRSLRGSEVKL